MNIRSSLAVLAAVPLFAVAACGSDASDLVADQDPTTPTASRTTPESEPPSDGGTASGSALTKQNFVATVSAAQIAAQSAHIAADIRAAGQLVVLEGDVRVGDTLADYAADVSMSGSGVGQGLQMVVVDQVLYLNLGQTTANKFAKIDLGNDNSAMGQLMSQFLSSADPSKSLEAMAKGVTGFKAVGSEKIDGVDTTQYRVEVDTRAILAAQGMGDLPGAAAGQLPRRLSYEMWIGNDDNLLRRTSLSMGSAMELTMDISAWGEPVDISAPAQSQIAKASPLAGLAQG